jgi:hypothetical protein
MHRNLSESVLSFLVEGGNALIIGETEKERATSFEVF